MELNHRFRWSMTEKLPKINEKKKVVEKLKVINVIIAYNLQVISCDMIMFSLSYQSMALLCKL